MKFKILWSESWDMALYAEVEAKTKEEAREKFENGDWDERSYSYEQMSNSTEGGPEITRLDE